MLNFKTGEHNDFNLRLLMNLFDHVIEPEVAKPDRGSDMSSSSARALARTLPRQRLYRVPSWALIRILALLRS